MSFVQKYPLIKSLNQFTQDKFETANDVLSKSAPATVKSVDKSGTIVTVDIAIKSLFTIPSITMPVATTKYVRNPIQPGDPGVVVSSDFYLGGVSGLGGGQADLTQQANLATLVFIPIGNTGNDQVIDPNAVQIQGFKDSGVILLSGDKNVKLVLDKDGITVTIGDQQVLKLTKDEFDVTVNSRSINIGGSDISIGPNTVIDGREFLPHQHQDVQTGTSDTGPVV